MSAQRGIAISTTIVGSFTTFPSEVIAVTTPQLNLPFDNQLVLIFWYVKFTPGATGPVVIYNLRRGTLITSPLVTSGANTVTELGTVGITRCGFFIDTVSLAGTPQYSLTMNVQNAASNGAFNEACLIALAL